jgi:hypothetical protein
MGGKTTQFPENMKATTTHRDRFDKAIFEKNIANGINCMVDRPEKNTRITADRVSAK